MFGPTLEIQEWFALNSLLRLSEATKKIRFERQRNVVTKGGVPRLV